MLPISHRFAIDRGLSMPRSCQNEFKSPKSTWSLIPACMRGTPPLFVIFVLLACNASGETGAEAWLRYTQLDPGLAEQYASLPAALVTLGDSAVLTSAQTELLWGIRGMLGRSLRIMSRMPSEASIVLGTIEQVHRLDAGLEVSKELRGDAFALISATIHGQSAIVITGETDRAVLYGAFAFLKRIAQAEHVTALNELESPSAPVRWVNQWDNLDGSIERGYGGHSIFFDSRHVRD